MPNMGTDQINIYAKFEKIDRDKRIVAGWASTEKEDTQGEIVKIEAIEKALPDYMKFANIREMHQWSAVGRTIMAKIDKKKRGLWIKGKIVDRDAWEKVKERVYNGFSIGGKVLKKIGNVVYELVLNEISLVDRPSNPEAVFNLVKFEGGEIVEKQLPIAPTGLSGLTETTYPGIKIADKLIALAASLTYLMDECERLKRPKKHLEKVLRQLKQAALFELENEKTAIEKRISEANQKKFEKISSIEKKLAEIIMNKNLDQNWSMKYFEDLRRHNG